MIYDKTGALYYWKHDLYGTLFIETNNQVLYIKKNEIVVCLDNNFFDRCCLVFKGIKCSAHLNNFDSCFARLIQ